jgi:putative peptide zinc metalloprotease protein
MTLSIALYLAGHYFVLGVALAIASVTAQVALPALRHIFYVLTDPVVAERRGRALLGSLGLAVVLGTLLVAVPLPLRTRSEGVVWLPERSHVRAGAEGFVVELLSDPHREVRQGDPLIRTRDPALETRLRVLEAQVREQAVRIHSLQPENLVQSEIARERLAETEAALARAREQAGDVVIVSPADGVFVLVGGDDLLGRYVKHGEGVAFVVDLSDTIVRVVVPQEQVALLREPTTTAWVRLAHDLGTVLPARIVRAVPAATNLLPIRSLGTSGGGRIAVDPLDPDGLRTLEPMFEFDLALPEGAGLPAAGARVYVRFDHVAEPLAKRGYRALRRLFLRQLGV